MRKLISLPVVAALLGLAAACQEQHPTAPESAIAADHGRTGVIEARADYRAVGTEAAENHGLRVGESVGTLSVTDDGSDLTVSGEASGLDSEGLYVSLFYDLASPAQGPEACEPGVGENHPLFLTDEQMEIGSGGSIDVWDVDANGDATLGPTSTLEYVPAQKIGTVSIRDVRVNDGFGAQAVVACGVVRGR